MKTLQSLLKAYYWTNGGEDEALTDAKNQEHYLKVKWEDQNPNRNPLAELSVEKNPGAFQKAQPGACVAATAAPKHALLPLARTSQRICTGVLFRARTNERV